jgi:hypothetical protein
MKPTPPRRFEDETSLILSVITETCLNETEHELTQEQIAWFQSHVDIRIRWIHANNTPWRKVLNGPTNNGRDRVYTFVSHWLAAYLLDHETYVAKHPKAVFV